jgi:membrane-bound metal-dependent hydrolase YbcI (DUF457 family)
MPLLGHALVGLATGMAVAPFSRYRPPSSRRQQAAAALWLPTAVGLAYLPDLATQLALLAGFPRARIIAHSILFALVVAPMIAAVGAWLGGLPPLRLFAVALGSIGLHDALDVVQSTDRAPWWPLSDRPVDLGVSLLPIDPWREALLFAVLFAVFLAGRAVTDRLWPRSLAAGPGPALRWTGRTLMVALVLVAGHTHYLRAVREQRFLEARALVERRHHRRALDALAEAERWPSTAKPGRIDHLRGEAWLGLGDRDRAERYYRRSYAADAAFFWVVADLAAFYASADAPPAERRLRAQPYLDRLRRDFAAHGALPATLAKIERKLAAPTGGGD